MGLTLLISCFVIMGGSSAYLLIVAIIGLAFLALGVVSYPLRNGVIEGS